MFAKNISSEAEIYFLFRKKNIVLQNDFSPLPFALLKELQNQNAITEFFSEDTIKLYSAAELNENYKIDDTLKEISVREYFSNHSQDENFLCARATSILKWRMMMKFCPTCAKPLQDEKIFSAKQCPVCKKEFFPKIEPCIIVLVKKDEKILLVRHTYRNQDMFACVAGFIEAGENAEHAVYREVYEETGIKIKNVQYKGSQAWPFPDQLMFAFTADYESGELNFQKDEIAEGDWFNKDNLPNGPKKGSVAYRLIHDEF